MRKYVKYFAMFIIAAMTLSSCKKSPAALQAPVVKSSTSSVVISELNDKELIKFEWTSASSSASVQYSFQITQSTDTGFASGVSINMGDKTSKSYTANEISALMKELSIPEKTSEFTLIARVRATAAGLTAVNSENVTVKFAMDLPAYIPKTLFIVGNATDFSWNRNDLEKQGLTKGENGIFTWTGNLYKTDTDGFKFLEPESGEFIPCYVRDAEAKDYWTLRLNTTYDDPDIKFQVEEDGIYNLTLDVIKLTIKAERIGDIYVDPDEVIIDALYPIGDAFEWGWSQDNAKPMEKIAKNTFRWVGYLNGEKEFKFLCQNDGNWAPAFVRDTKAGEYWSIVYTANGAIDEKFQVDANACYVITIFADTKAPTIEVKEYTTETLYLIGEAFSWGWSQDSAEAMTATEELGVYTWTGTMIGNKDFKFLCQNNGWEPGYNRDANAEDNWTVAYRPDGNAPDEKFKVEADGTYKLTLNVIERTLKAELQ